MTARSLGTALFLRSGYSCTALIGLLVRLTGFQFVSWKGSAYVPTLHSMWMGRPHAMFMGTGGIDILVLQHLLQSSALEIQTPVPKFQPTPQPFALIQKLHMLPPLHHVVLKTFNGSRVTCSGTLFVISVTISHHKKTLKCNRKWRIWKGSPGLNLNGGNFLPKYFP